MTFDEAIKAIFKAYDDRNEPPFEWADGKKENVAPLSAAMELKEALKAADSDGVAEEGEGEGDEEDEDDVDPSD